MQGAKMTVMDILEFRDMNGSAPMPKSRVMRSDKVLRAILTPFSGLKFDNCKGREDSFSALA